MSVIFILTSILRDIKKTSQAQLLKFKYSRTMCRLRKAYGSRKIIVAFCVSEIAKWKSQSLYDKLELSDAYRPVIFIYPSPLEINGKASDLKFLLEGKALYFESKKMEVMNIWDYASEKCIFPNDVFPDIVFYQQPWDIPPFPAPFKIANHALSFYIPYYLINNFNIDIEFGLPLHYQVFGYIVQNEQVTQLFSSNLTQRHYAGKCLGLGHTIVDYLTTDVVTTKKNSVIYAPHFSFPVEGVDRVLTYSTFLDNGKLILEFAKQHPEIDWVFKPHPRLRIELENTGVWTKAEIDSYYEEWAKIGVICTTSDYAEHFQKSFAMITDCGSFMTEYSCMDNPLIRLYYYEENLPPNPILEKLYDTFYYAHNNEELMEYLDLVILRKQDPKKPERHKEVTNLGLNQSNTAQKIVNYLESLISSR